MEKFFQNKYELNLKNKLICEKKELIEFRAQKKIMPERFKNHPASELNYKYLSGIKKLLLVIIYVLNVEIFSLNIIKKKI